MKFCSIAIFALSMILPRPAASQTVGRILLDDATNVAKDVGAIWSSPFDASGRDWLLAGASFAAFGVSMLADQSLSDWAIESKDNAFFSSIKEVRRGGKLFSGKYVVPPIAAVYIIGVATNNQGMRDFVMGCAAAWGSQSPLRKVVYRIVGRARPDTLPNDPQNWELFPGDDWMMRSFPAGHFANALSCVTFWNKRFRMGPAEPALYALAAAIGVGRMADEAHWTSDTVIGGILGYAVGSEIARRSLSRQAMARGLSTSSLYISPGASGTTVGLRWSF